MKKLIYAFLGVMTLFVFSCTSDPCKDKSAATLCSGKGTLADMNGNCGCNCDAGYTGTDCSVTLSSLFPGTYSCTEVGTKSGNSSYTATVSASTTLSQVNVKNVWGQFANNVKVGISNDGKATITLQEPDGDNFFVQNGSGTWEKNASGKIVIKMSYEVEDKTTATAIVDKLTATWTQL